MKKQILVIGGGDSFRNSEEYLESLKKKVITLEKLRMRGWKERLGDVLGKDYDVLVPRLPNTQNCQYPEWKIIFEKVIPLLDDEVILIGHSQGGIFLAKYLSENNFPKKVRGLFLVSPPFSDTQNIGNFALDRPLANVSKQCANIHLFQSKDDPTVPFSEIELYKKELSGATLHIFEDKGHFISEEFPEIVVEIKNIYD